jgi:hypothetical protein
MSGPTKGRADHLVLGDYNAVCSLCGFKRKASTMVKNWQGWYRCPEHNEPRQPQDFVRGEPDIQTVPWAQPPTFIYEQICTLNSISAIPGAAGPGCMIPGNRVFDVSLPFPTLPPPRKSLSILVTDTGAILIDNLGNVFLSG